MNILIVTRYNDDGGVVTHVINLANGLAARGNNVVVAAPLDSAGGKGRYEALQCTFSPINFESKNMIGILKRLGKIIKKHNIQIVHSHNRNTSLFAQFFKLTKRVPLVWTLHQNNIPTRFPYKLLTFPGDRTIAVSGELKDFCVQKLGIPEDNVEIIYNGVYESKYVKKADASLLEKFGANADEVVITQLARLERRKGHMMLLEAVDRLRADRPVRVLITGTDLDDGEYRHELDSYIHEHSLGNIVNFIGYVDPVEVLSVSDAMVLPSKNEGQPIAVTEAFLMRVPVIRTKTGGYEETKDLCIGIDDDGQLTDALRRVVDGDPGLKPMTQSAYEFALENCTVSAMTARVENVYAELIKR